MKLESVRLRAMGPAFPEEVSIDFTAIPGKVIAVTGRNMAGKSSLLELILPGVLYRDCPTRGPLRELAGPGALLEATVVNGRRYTIRHELDGISAGNASVVDDDGKSLLPNRLVSSYDAWAKKMLPPKDLVLASLFAATKDLGILQMDSGDRKALFLRAIGVDRYRALTDRARKRVASAKVAFDVAESRVRDEKGRSIPIDKALADVEFRRSALAQEEEVATFVAAELAEAESLAASVATSNEEARRLTTALESARNAAAAAERRLSDLQARRLSLQETLDLEPKIRSANDRVRTIDDELRAFDLEVKGAKAAEVAARDRVETAKRAADHALEALRRARAAVDNDAARAREREAHLAAAEGIPAAEQAVAAAEERVRTADAEVASLQETRLHGAESRIHGLQGGLVWYQNSSVDALVADAGKVAADALSADRELEDDIRRLPEESKAAATVLRSAKEALAATQRDLAALVDRRTRAEALTSPPGLSEALLEAARAHDEAKAAHEVATNDFEKLTTSYKTRVDRSPELRMERARLAPTAARLPAIEGARALQAELTDQIAASEVEVRRLRVAVDEAEANAASGPKVEALPELAARRAAAAEATKHAGAARTAFALAERSLQEATASAERLTELEAKRDAAAVELADWTRLANELGPDGLQALAIDAAGPEISDLTNALLHKCVSTRFTVSVETSAKSEDSDREVCEIRVLDSENGLWTKAERLSGAGGALVGEALRWALVILTCRRWKIEEPTIVRDEAGATLEPANARAYVAMLRQAAEMVGASRVLFVSQSPEIQALADARIHVEGGKVSIEVN